MILTTYLMGQVANIDSHRTGHRAEAVSGTGLFARIRVLLLQFGEQLRILTCLSETFNFSLEHYSGPWRHCKAARHAVYFTETALYTFVDLRICGRWLFRSAFGRLKQRQGLEVLEAALGVIVEYDTRIKNVLWIENSLYAFHDIKCLFSPLVLYIRSHIASCAMLCFKWTVIFLYD